MCWIVDKYSYLPVKLFSDRDKIVFSKNAKNKKTVRKCKQRDLEFSCLSDTFEVSVPDMTGGFRR